MKLSKYQKEILENLKDGGCILVYSSRLDVRCLLSMPDKNESKTIRFDTFAKLAEIGLIKRISGETPFNSWEGKWVLKK